MKSHDARIMKLEKMIDEILNPKENIPIIVNKSAGETKEAKTAEVETQGKKVKFIITVSGLGKI
ncbi:MAG: hypothetical protein ABR980_13685 [Ignavibacteriaceae bacterium]|jgi:hypothetical protein